ncbi:MAG: helix-turn-helix domain-containing protein [Bacteroidales bacterium]|nr:helix-turn-helix domain-containing protein [Bacteroidales bacterium]
MKERIIAIIKEKNLTLKDFVEKVGIQRSTLSHIITGRNNPSLELLIKILKTFPDINVEWLLLGVGSMFKNNVSTISEETFNLPILEKSNDNKDSVGTNLEKNKLLGELVNNNAIYRADNESITKLENINDVEKENISKIIILYKDNTAEVYRIKK